MDSIIEAIAEALELNTQEARASYEAAALVEEVQA